MCKTCAFPDCGKDISVLPNGHILCTDHQIGLNLFIQDVEKWIGEKLEQVDYLFLYLHQSGSDVKTADSHLVGVVDSTGTKSPLQNGWLKGTKVGRNVWHIPFAELLRAISLARNWVSIRKAGREYSIQSGKFYDCAKAGEFGKTQMNLSGALCIRRSAVKAAIIKYRAMVEEIRKTGAKSSNRFIQPGEFSTEMIADILGISSTSIRRRMKNGDINHRCRKSCKFSRMEDIQDFVQKILDGRIMTKKWVKKLCREFRKLNKKS